MSVGGKWGKLDVELAASQYEKGWTLAQIAKEHDVAISTVHLHLTKAGVRMRDPVDAQIYWSKAKKPRRRQVRRTKQTPGA